MKNENTRGIREGAMMVALTVVFMLLNKYVPLFSVVGTFLMGIPMAALAVRNGFKVIVPAVIAAFLVAVLVDGGVLAAVSTMLLSVIPGAVAGYMLGKKKPFFGALLGTSLAVCFGWIFELLVLELFVGSGIDQIISETIEQTKAVMSSAIQSVGSAMSEKTGMTPEAFADTLFNTIAYMFRLYIPTMVVLSSLFSGYIVLRLSAFFINRTKLAAVKSVAFSEMKAPRSVSAVAVILYIIYMFTEPMTAVWSVIANMVFILYAVLACCGLSFLDYKLKTKIKAAPLRFLIYGAVMLFGGFLMGLIFNALIITGILDSGRNFRGLEEKDTHSV